MIQRNRVRPRPAELTLACLLHADRAALVMKDTPCRQTATSALTTMSAHVNPVRSSAPTRLEHSFAVVIMDMLLGKEIG